MRWAPLGLLVATLLSVSARAEGDAPVGESAPAAQSEPAPELVQLGQELTKIQEAKEQGRVTSARYQEFLVVFRAKLEAAMADAASSPANIALHSRILARLGEFARAADALDGLLRKNPGNTTLRVALSQVRFDEKDYPAALAEADAVLKLDPSNKEALTLKHFSEGRVAMNGETVGGNSPLLPSTPAHKSFAHRFHFTAADPATLPYKLPVKISPATVPPDLRAHGAPASPGPLPLLPLAEIAALGLAAYEVSRSRTTQESTDGLDDEHPKPVGRYQRLVAGTILAGAFGAVVYLTGAAVVSAAPVALGYAANLGSQGLRLAGSEVGAINSASAEKMEEVVPQAEAAGAEVEQVIIKKGEILNRVWHSDWTPASGHSGPEGFSYCRGACLPIHAGQAIEGRGLNVGVINNARQGGLYRAMEDIAVTTRQSIGGYEEEILLRSPEDIKKLEPIRESVSFIPHR